MAVVLLAALVTNQNGHSAFLFVAEEVGALVVALAEVGALEDGGGGFGEADVAGFLHYIL